MAAKPTPRRPVGSGTLRQRSTGIWELRVYLGADPVTGRPVQRSRTVRAPTVEDANQELAEFVSEMRRERPTAENRTVATVLEEWFNHLPARGRSPRTIEAARYTIDNILVPVIGTIPVAELTGRHLDELYRRLLTGEGRDRALAPASVIRHHSVLRAALNQAVKWGWLDTNPAERATPPTQEAAQLEIPTSDDVRRLLTAASERNERWGMLVALAIGTGARRGELCGLQWPDVAGDTIRIRRSIYRVDGQTGVKSAQGGRERWVVVNPALGALLEGWRRRCEELAAQMGVELVDDAYVVSPWPDGSRPTNPDTFSSVVHQLCAKATKENPKGLGIPHVHLHSLRHYAATVMIGAGVSPRDAAELLGHANPSVTLRVYAHGTADRQREAAAVLGAALIPAESRSQQEA